MKKNEAYESPIFEKMNASYLVIKLNHNNTYIKLIKRS